MRVPANATVLAAVLLLAACGGSNKPRRHVHLTAAEHIGRTLFIRTCGGCHTLADAGTSGIAGPSLDQPWEKSRVLEVIADGPAQMPADLLTGRSAADVAAYVAAATGG